MNKMLSGSLTVIIYKLITFIHEEEYAYLYFFLQIMMNLSVWRETLQALPPASKAKIIFDGTTRFCESMVIVVCFVHDNWHLQRLLRWMLLAKSLKWRSSQGINYMSLSNQLGS